MSTYRYIAQRQAQVPVRPLCQVLRVAPAAYYAWQRDRQLPRAEPAWQVAVREAFAYHSQRYGTRRLRAEVQAQGHRVGRWRIRRVLKAHGLRALRVRPSSPARSCRAPRTSTRPCALPLTACIVPSSAPKLCTSLSNAARRKRFTRTHNIDSKQTCK